MWNEAIKINRDDLYKMVWTEPMIKTAAKYGLSDRGLAKICAKLKIPVPGRGYWAKIRRGLKIPRPPLNPSSHPEVALIYSKTPKEKLTNDPLTELILSEKKPDKKIKVAPQDENHPLIIKTESSLRHARLEKGLIKPRASGCLDIHVSPESLERSILIMSALINALEERELNLFKAPDSNVIGRIKVFDEVLDIGIDEGIKCIEKKLSAAQEKRRKEHPWIYTPGYDYVPTGVLTLKIKNERLYNTRKNWSDGKIHKLEDLLNSFIAGLFKAAEAIKTDRLEREKREREWERQRQERLERERLRIEEEKKIKELDAQISAWNKSQLIRSYLEALTKAVIEKHGEIQAGSEMDKWITWVDQYSKKIDPLNTEFDSPCDLSINDLINDYGG
jgi:hypothetical protein